MKMLLGILRLITFLLVCLDAQGIFLPIPPILPIPPVPPISPIPAISVDGDGVHVGEEKIPMGNPACKNCTDYVYGKQALALQAFNKTEHSFPGIEPCYYYEYDAGDSVGLIGDACVKTVKPNVTQTTLYIRIGELNVKAQCTLNIIQNLADVANIANTAAANLTEDSLCNGDDVTQLAEGTVGGSTFALFHSQDLVKTALNCVTIKTNSSILMQNFNLTGRATNIIIKIVVQVDKNLKGLNKYKITQLEDINQSFSNSTVECHSDGDIEFCDCLVDNHMYAVTIQEVLTTLTTCGGKTNKDLLIAAAEAECSDFA